VLRGGLKRPLRHSPKRLFGRVTTWTAACADEGQSTISSPVEMGGRGNWVSFFFWFRCGCILCWKVKECTKYQKIKQKMNDGVGKS